MFRPARMDSRFRGNDGKCGSRYLFPVSCFPAVPSFSPSLPASQPRHHLTHLSLRIPVLQGGEEGFEMGEGDLGGDALGEGGDDPAANPGAVVVQVGAEDFELPLAARVARVSAVRGWVPSMRSSSGRKVVSRQAAITSSAVLWIMSR